MATIPHPDDADPIKSYAWAAAELDVDLSTFRRRILPTIPIVEISPRRRGVRRSVIETVKRLRTRQPVLAV